MQIIRFFSSPTDYYFALAYLGGCLFLSGIALPALAETSDSLQGAGQYDKVELALEEGERWWGGAVVDGTQMPFTSAGVGSAGFSYNQLGNNKANQAQPLWISSHGRYLWCEEPIDLRMTQESIRAASQFAPVVSGKAGTTLRDAFLYVSRQYFPPTGTMPDARLFALPQYNTWIELQKNQNERDIRKYARDIVKHGFPPGVLMIDDTWQDDYGMWRFSAERFDDPQGLIDELHELGFPVMLWVCPFVSPDSHAYRDLKKRGLFLFEDKSRQEPAIVRWWNGASALLDLSNPEAMQWYTEQLDSLVQEYGVDGFKLDAGDSKYYVGEVYSPSSVHPNRQSELHASVGLKYPLNEYRASWKMGGQPLVQRLRDKHHNWADLQTLIPCTLAQGLVGYAFVCPDMIGGGEAKSFTDDLVIDQELIVRSTQCQALTPMMQFSVAPWRILSKENLAICLEMAQLHARMGEEILALARESAKSGEPIARHMEYQFPHQGYAEIKDQFMLGSDILVAPVVEKGATARFISFPPGEWQGDDGSLVVGPVRVQVDTPLDRLPWYRRVSN